MNQVILIDPVDKIAVEVTEDFLESKGTALMMAEKIHNVETDEENEDALVCLENLKYLVKEIEESRKLVKEPVLKLGKQIDQLAKLAVKELEAEKKRLSLLTGDYIKAAEAIGEKPDVPSGTQVRSTIILDEVDAKTLYGHYPQLVELKPINSAIKSVIKKDPKSPLPGVKFHVEHKTV